MDIARAGRAVYGDRETQTSTPSEIAAEQPADTLVRHSAKHLAQFALASFPHIVAPVRVHVSTYQSGIPPAPMYRETRRARKLTRATERRAVLLGLFQADNGIDPGCCVKQQLDSMVGDSKRE